MKHPVRLLALAALLAVAGSSAVQAAGMNTLVIDYSKLTSASAACYASAAAHACDPALAMQRQPAYFSQRGGLDAGNERSDELAAADRIQAGQADAAAAPVPEPHMLLMMLIGLGLLGFSSSRREASDKFTV